MKKTSKIIALLVVAMMCLTVVLAACQPAAKMKSIIPGETEGYSMEDYLADSKKLYDSILGDFYTAYQKAKNDAETLSERYALMAIAEAKLLESGVMLPLSSRGGNYAIGRTVPYTVTPVLWGNDSERMHNMIVTNEIITLEDRNALKALYAEAETAEGYEADAKDYLAAHNYTIKNSYTQAYSSDPTTWDVLATSKAVDSEAIVNTYDGLVEYDNKNILQPALAESWEVSEDGKTYTFTIREGAIWVDSQGDKVADVTADDFVAGFQHMLDAEGGLEDLVRGLIVNADEYLNGEVTDFAQVGVKAEDGKVIYTLESEASYFLTMLSYGLFAPMSRSYYVSEGGKFGSEFDKAAADYNYGKDPSHIAYCGPYLVTNNTAKNTIAFTQNNSYWNKDNINLTSITWKYNDGSEATKSYEDMKKGDIDASGLNASALAKAKEDKAAGSDKTYFELYGYVTATDATSFMAFENVNRLAYVNFNDEKAAVTMLTEAESARTSQAMLNVHFRRALAFALDRETYNAATTGAELAKTSLRNCYTPGTFVVLDEETTVAINGTNKTYPAGTYYGKIMQDQIDADGIKIKVWDPTADGGIGSSDGFDGWYNAENAAAELAKAIEELTAGENGLTIDKAHPIYIELPCYSASTAYSNRAQVYKKSIEAALDGKVIVNLIDCPKPDDWYGAGYDTEEGYQANYTIYDLSGWGPDYGDPQTYLDTFLPGGAGYMVKCIGIY